MVLQECWPMFLFCIALLLWIFPEGTLPPGRWRRPAVVLVTAGLLVSVAASTHGVLVVAGGDVRLQANGDLANPLPRALAVLSAVVIAATVVSWVAWLAIQIPAYRHADGERRQQLKWLYGFGTVRDVRQRDMIPAAAWDRSDSLCPAELSHIAHARIRRP